MKAIRLMLMMVFSLVSLDAYEEPERWDVVTEKTYENIVGKKWVFVGTENAKFQNPERAVLAFRDGVDKCLKGRFFVNTYFGGLEFKKDGSIKVRRLEGTQMAGDPEMMKQGAKFVELLGEVEEISYNGEGILRLKGEGDTLFFRLQK